MSHLTKIIATIGPASDSPEKIKQLIDLGVDIFRFNFKHNSVDWHEQRIKLINQINQQLGKHIGTLIDLQGPEIRLMLPYSPMPIDKDELIPIKTDFQTGEHLDKFVHFTTPEITAHLTAGDVVMADDGQLEFEVVRKDDQTFLRSKQAGELLDKKTINFPGLKLDFYQLIERDLEGIKLAERHQIDYVALSFVRTADDIRTLRQAMDEYQLQSQIIAKIENQQAIEHLDEIIYAADGIMVARGDLGVELPLEQVPYLTRKIIRSSIEHGKPVITATQMLQSMIEHPYPTRAEISDIATAIYSYTDAIMLSGETAVGKYPDKAVAIMRRTADFNEVQDISDIRIKFKLTIHSQTQMLAAAAYNLYLNLKSQQQPISAFVVFTRSGRTAKILSSFKPKVPIIAVCPEREIAESLSLYFAIHPFVQAEGEPNQAVRREDIQATVKKLVQANLLPAGQHVIALYGDYWSVKGGTSTIKLLATA